MQQENTPPEHIERPQQAPRPILPERHSYNSRRRLESIRTFFSTVLVVILAIGFAVFLTSFVFQSYQVEGPSMEPTLHNQDRLIVWKVPRTLARVTGNAYIPARGDIIVFNEQGMLNSNGTVKQLIKRVIGLPGDRIVVSGGQVQVFNDESPNGFNPDVTLGYNNGEPIPIDRDEEVDEVVPEDQLFVMGDNRGNSLDSRMFGPIDAKEVVGKLSIRLLPIENARSF